MRYHFKAKAREKLSSVKGKKIKNSYTFQHQSWRKQSKALHFKMTLQQTKK